jgi:hypothetical protein
MTDTINSSLPFIQDGRLKPLAVTSTRRLAALPNIPTLTELGLQDLEIGAWQGIVAPAGTPPEVVQKVNGAMMTALKNPEFLSRLETQQTTPLGSTPEEYASTSSPSSPLGQGREGKRHHHELRPSGQGDRRAQVCRSRTARSMAGQSASVSAKPASSNRFSRWRVSASATGDSRARSSARRRASAMTSPGSASRLNRPSRRHSSASIMRPVRQRSVAIVSPRAEEMIHGPELEAMPP